MVHVKIGGLFEKQMRCAMWFPIKPTRENGYPEEHNVGRLHVKHDPITFKYRAKTFQSIDTNLAVSPNGKHETKRETTPGLPCPLKTEQPPLEPGFYTARAAYFVPVREKKANHEATVDGRNPAPTKRP